MLNTTIILPKVYNGISFGEEQEDVTKENPYGYIPAVLQTFPVEVV